MASVELSTGIMSALPARIIFPNATSNRSNSSGLNYNYTPLLPYNWTDFNAHYTFGFISIYQGIVPTDFSTLTTPSSRSADVLITFNCTFNVPQIFDMTINVSGNPGIINSAFVLASASGTATWFRWYTVFNNASVVHQIIGTVGATGSGADLEIPSTAIVSGRAYRIQNLRIQFPSSWSY